MAIKIRLLVRVGCDFVVHTQVKAAHLLLRKSEKYVSMVWVSRNQMISIPQVLNEIATLYFAIPAPRTQANNPFGDMLSTLFGGGAPGQSARRMLQPTGVISTSDLDWNYVAKFEYIKKQQFSRMPGLLADLTETMLTMSHRVNSNNLHLGVSQRVVVGTGPYQIMSICRFGAALHMLWYRELVSSCSPYISCESVSCI